MVWTPLHRARARLQRVTVECPGTLDHFRDAMLLGEVLVKAHVVTLIALANDVENASAKHLEFDLSRADGFGEWSKAAGALVRFPQLTHGLKAGDPLHDAGRSLLEWLAKSKRRDDRDALSHVLAPFGDLRDRLVEQSQTSPVTSPLAAFRTLVEIRNATYPHGNQGPLFWQSHANTLASAVEWLTESSPLSSIRLAATVGTPQRRAFRILEGGEPTTVANVSFSGGLAALLLTAGARAAAVPNLVHVDPGTNHVFFANGKWRDSDASLQFMCHAVSASEPGEGLHRKVVEEYSIAPLVSVSETAGLDELVDENGVLHCLPLPSSTYVPRPTLEQQLTAYLIEPRVRHVINLRGAGGFGKTSVALHLCRDLVRSGKAL